MIESFLIGLVVFGADLGALFFIAKKIVRIQEQKSYLKFFFLKFFVLFVVLGAVFKVLKPDLIWFTGGALCSLIIAGILIFLLNKNN